MDVIPAKAGVHSQPTSFQISTATGHGIDQLLIHLETEVRQRFSGEGAIITRSRHRNLLIGAKAHLENFSHVSVLELKCEELRLAANLIGKITGKIAVDDILDVVFSQFCIGK